MPLDFVQLEFWTYGFFGAVFLANAGWALGITAIWWFVYAYIAIHREDPQQLQFDFHVWWLPSICSGLLVGTSLLATLRMDTLIDSGFLNYRNAKRYYSLEFVLTVVFTSITSAGYYYYSGHLSDGFGLIPLSTARAVGITLFVVGGFTLLGLFVWMFINRTDRKETSLNAKYILALALGITAGPVGYDYALLAGLSPWHGLVALGAIILYWALMILWLGFTSVDATTGKFKFGNWISKSDDAIIASGLKNHSIDRWYSPRQLIVFLIAGFVLQFVVYLVGWLVDAQPWLSPEPTVVKPPVIAIAVTSIVETIALWVVYYFGRGSSWWPSATKRVEVVNYDTHVSGKLH